MAATYIPNPQRRSNGFAAGIAGVNDLISVVGNAYLTKQRYELAKQQVSTAALEEHIKQAEAAVAPDYYGGRARQEQAKAGQEEGTLAHQPTAFDLDDDKKRSQIRSTDAETQRRNAAAALLELQGYGQQYKNTILGPLLAKQAEARVGLIQRQGEQAAARTKELERHLAPKPVAPQDQFFKDLDHWNAAAKYGLEDKLLEMSPDNPNFKMFKGQAKALKGNPLMQRFNETGDEDLARAISAAMVKKQGLTPADEGYDTSVESLTQRFIDAFNKRMNATASRMGPAAYNATVDRLSQQYVKETRAKGQKPNAKDARAFVAQGLKAADAGNDEGDGGAAPSDAGVSAITDAGNPDASAAAAAPIASAQPAAPQPATVTGAPFRLKNGRIVYRQPDGSWLDDQGNPITQ